MVEQTKGFAFPFNIDPKTGGVSFRCGHDKIRQNIHLILGTRQGERPMMRNFGSRISSLVHEPNDDVLKDLIQKQTQTAIMQWEPRVLITKVYVEQHEGEYHMRIEYVFIDDSETGEFLLPLK